MHTTEKPRLGHNKLFNEDSGSGHYSSQEIDFYCELALWKVIGCSGVAVGYNSVPSREQHRVTVPFLGLTGPFWGFYCGSYPSHATAYPHGFAQCNSCHRDF